MSRAPKPATNKISFFYIEARANKLTGQTGRKPPDIPDVLQTSCFVYDSDSYIKLSETRAIHDGFHRELLETYQSPRPRDPPPFPKAELTLFGGVKKLG